jgi:hypothetical protein
VSLRLAFTLIGILGFGTAILAGRLRLITSNDDNEEAAIQSTVSVLPQKNQTYKK